MGRNFILSVIFLMLFGGTGLALPDWINFYDFYGSPSSGSLAPSAAGTCPHLCRHAGADGCTPVVSAASMTVGTSSKTVTFAHPFLLKGVDRILAARDYRILTDEELIEELSFPVYRRVATMIFVPAEFGSASTVEMVAIDPQDLQAAQELDLNHWPLVFQIKAARLIQLGAPCGFGGTTALWRRRFS